MPPASDNEALKAVALPPLRQLPPSERELQARQRSAIRASLQVERAVERTVGWIYARARERITARLAPMINMAPSDPNGAPVLRPEILTRVVEEALAEADRELSRMLAEATRQVALAGAASQALLVEEVELRAAEAPRVRVVTSGRGGVPRIEIADMPPSALFGQAMVTPELLQALEQLSAQEVTTLTTRYRSVMLGAIRRAAVDQLTIDEAMRIVNQHLPQSRRGARVTRGIGYSAERIVRTQLGRAFNTSADVAARQLAERVSGVNLMREWVAVLDNRTRPSHIRAHGQRRRVGEPFRVGGHLLRFPGDPKGPPGETINCRCRAITVVA